jgi:hypothetical protein
MHNEELVVGNTDFFIKRYVKEITIASIVSLYYVDVDGKQAPIGSIIDEELSIKDNTSGL